MGKSIGNREVIIRGRRIGDAEIGEVRLLLKEHDDFSRTQLSRALAELWDWRQANGHLKDRACREVLNGLASRGLIELPTELPRSNRAVTPLARRLTLNRSLIDGCVDDFLPLRFELVDSRAGRALWRGVISNYHYLGHQSLVGANLKYLVYWQDRLLAALGFQSAVKDLRSRDRLIGWDADQRRKHLHRVATHSRFLIMPWVRMRNLASYVLGRTLRRLSADWNKKYGYELWLVESFVDPSRFLGSCYQAANWLRVGLTKGLSKIRGGFVYHGQPKEVYVYVIDKLMRHKIGCAMEGDPVLTREFLLSRKSQLALSKRRRKMIIRHEGWHPDLAPRLDLTPADVDNLADELGAFHKLFEEGFKRVEQHQLGLCYLQGLISDVERKSVEPMALRLSGPKAVRSLQRFISVYKWDEEFIGNRHRRELADLIGVEDGAFSVDSSEFVKAGNHSVGVSRQYCGRLGKIENCQSGVFVSYAGSKGFGLVDRRLFMPERWFSEDYRERREKCKVPEDLTFKSKPQLALEMIKQLHSEGVFPGRWVTCDTIFGNSADFVDGLPNGLYYLAEVVKTTKVWAESSGTTIDVCQQARSISEVAEDPAVHWHEVKLLEGAKGPIMAEVARLRVITEKDGQEKWLFLRRCPESGQIKYFLSNAPVDTPLEEMIHVCTLRWPVEQCFQEGKGELGMDHYEHRSWSAWHRHMTYVFLAQLFLLRIRFTLKKTPPT